MAVFVAASDESTDGTVTGQFFLGGWVARERLWTKAFAPDWQRRVLAGPPKIDYLHMVDIKSPKWREERGITFEDAERRLDAAFELIEGARGLTPIVYTADAGHFRRECANLKLVIQTEGGTAYKRYEPDYACFLHYVMEVLHYVHKTHEEVEKIDFVVERKDGITKNLEWFHESIARVLNANEAAHLGRLVGELIPGGKDRVPLQAADLLCWHTQASKAGTLSEADLRRYLKLDGRPGMLKEYTNEEITAFAQRAGDAVIMDVGEAAVQRGGT